MRPYPTRTRQAVAPAARLYNHPHAWYCCDFSGSLEHERLQPCYSNKNMQLDLDPHGMACCLFGELGQGEAILIAPWNTCSAGVLLIDGLRCISKRFLVNTAVILASSSEIPLHARSMLCIPHLGLKVHLCKGLQGCKGRTPLGVTCR